MTRLPFHAEMRIRQRLGIKRCTREFLMALWVDGRVAEAGDFKVFDTTWRQDRQYRVVAHEGQPYMLVRDAHDGNFITVLKP